jgi:tyrosyl-tRNA synthetase
MDFMRIALTYREEITKLSKRHEEHVQNMYAEMEVVAEPVVPMAQGIEAAKEDEESGEDDFDEPYILNVLNKD